MKGKLIVGILYNGSKPLWEWAIGETKSLWGEIEHVSEIFPFPHTHYYKDIGNPLYRRFLSFQGLTEGSHLWERKIQAIALEKKSGNPRKINVDPGLLDGARLILASTKDRAQRVPISDTLYAEVTLRYKGKKWMPFDYTFPDFRGSLYYPFLENLRKDFLREIRKMKEEHA